MEVRTLVHFFTACLTGFFLVFSCGAIELSEAEQQALYDSMEPVYGPNAVDIVGKATVRMDSSLYYLNLDDTKKYLRLTDNLVYEEHKEVLIGGRESQWVAYFDFLDTGYVEDSEPPESDATLEEAKKNNKAGNVERQEQGLPLLHVDRWAIEPRYDRTENLLEWAMVVQSDTGEEINYHTRILGRKGTMRVVLVCSPDVLQSSIAELKKALRAYSFNAGERYADFKDGDKVAQYGLAALITGGAAALATKKGFWAAIGAFLIAAKKFIFVILIVALAKIGTIIRWIKSLFTSR